MMSKVEQALREGRADIGLITMPAGEVDYGLGDFKG